MITGYPDGYPRDRLVETTGSVQGSAQSDMSGGIVFGRELRCSLSQIDHRRPISTDHAATVPILRVVRLEFDGLGEIRDRIVPVLQVPGRFGRRDSGPRRRTG